MKPIELSVPADYEEVKAVLARISQTSYFEITPDGMKKSSGQKEQYQILCRKEGSDRAERVGLLELARTKEKVTTITISERYVSVQDSLPETGSMLTRFVGVLAQNLMSQGIKA